MPQHDDHRQGRIDDPDRRLRRRPRGGVLDNHASIDSLAEAVNDAYAYRLGEASSLDDLEPIDAECATKYATSPADSASSSIPSHPAPDALIRGAIYPQTAGQLDDVVDYFRVYRCDPEITLTVPGLDDGQPPLVIGIAALGGGTLGRAYADNDWVYTVHLDGVLVASGANLHSGAVARTHRQMAAVLATHLADDTAAMPPIAGQSDRLSLWADDLETAHGDD